MPKRRILIVDNNDELRAMLQAVLAKLGHDSVATGEREEALKRDDLDKFDLIISDLTEDSEPVTPSNGQPDDLKRRSLLTSVGTPSPEPVIVKAFKLGAANFRNSSYDKDELREIVEQTLSYKLRCVDDPSLLSTTHEKIEFELPSDLTLMNGVLHY